MWMAGKPVESSSEKAVPATLGRIICCTTTDMTASRCGITLRLRYSTARSVKHEAQQRRTEATTSCSPRWFRNVSCCPANEGYLSR